MTREDAINIVRNIYQTDKEKEALATLIPELRESEDERIRVRLIEYFKGFLEGFEDCYKDGGDVKWEGLDVKSILTWLEKQKEQKPNFSEKDSTDFEIEVHEIIAQARNDSRLDDADVLKQFEEEAAFALMLKANKLIEQKPAEWSEEDEEMLDAMIDIVSNSLYEPLCPREEMLAWLKSIRPSWKPSEEQMKAMSYFVRKHQATANRATTKWPEFEAFKSLYNDLKKL